ncbi:MAG: BlaI/MecI/CopY family transcriptional regulator [Mediterranea massiliensis]|nr:BlaI/MecI/CopY family transcriptional regulator [Mediterranea massiliensis]
MAEKKNWRGLTKREEEVMTLLWDNGPMFVREMMEKFTHNPHFNTVSTIVRILEVKGLVNHIDMGSTYQYYAVQSREEYGTDTLRGLVKRYFQNSYLSVVSSLVKDENISLDELKELIAMVENAEEEKEAKADKTE